MWQGFLLRGPRLASGTSLTARALHATRVCFVTLGKSTTVFVPGVATMTGEAEFQDFSNINDDNATSWHSTSDI